MCLTTYSGLRERSSRRAFLPPLLMVGRGSDLLAVWVKASRGTCAADLPS